MDLLPEIFTFTWSVPDKGFLWDSTARPAPGFMGEPPPPYPPPFLVPNPAGTCRILYRPLNGEGLDNLLTRFIETEPTEDAILNFANQFGMLGVDIALLPASGEGEVFFGESFLSWKLAIEELRAMVQVWEWLSQRNVAKLGQHIIWKKDYSAVFYFQGGVSDYERLLRGELLQKRSEIIADNKKIHPEAFSTWRKGDVIEPAKALLLLTVNRKLRGTTSPCLTLDRKGNLGGYIRPSNLLSAIWLLLYQWIAGEKRYRRCEFCHGWMDVTKARSDRKYHDKCGWIKRKRAQYQREKGEKSDGKA